MGVGLCARTRDFKQQESDTCVSGCRLGGGVGLWNDKSDQVNTYWDMHVEGGPTEIGDWQVCIHACCCCRHRLSACQDTWCRACGLLHKSRFTFCLASALDDDFSACNTVHLYTHKLHTIFGRTCTLTCMQKYVHFRTYLWGKSAHARAWLRVWSTFSLSLRHMERFCLRTMSLSIREVLCGSWVIQKQDFQGPR